MRFEQQFFEYFNYVESKLRIKPLNLGGVASISGGGGGPPGGFTGYLPQTRVAYDLSEAEVQPGTYSGSLLDNLNHIRYRIAQLEDASPTSGVLIVSENGTVIASGVTVIDVVGATVTAIPNGVTITISGVTISGTTTSGVTDHGLLTGLTDQDHPATAITYNNSTSGLLATNLQDALDEIVDLPVAVHSHVITDLTTNTTTSGYTLIADGGGGVYFGPASGVTASSVEHIFNEDHSSECDGVTKSFYTSSPFIENSTRVYLNGLRQRLGNTHDYTESLDLRIVTFTVAPFTDDDFIVDYLVNPDPPEFSSFTGPYVPGFGTLAELIYLQTHCHTSASDGSYTVSGVISYYSAEIDALAVTDHDEVTSQTPGMEFAIQASEMSPSTGHIIALNSDYARGAVTDLQTIIDGIVADGGYAILAHPTWDTDIPVATMQTLTDYIGIEIHNQHCVGLGTNRLGFAVDEWDTLLTSTRRNIWGFAVDDFHDIDYNETYNIGRTIAFCSERTSAALLEAVENGNFVADVSNYGVTPGKPTITSTGVSVTATGATSIRFIGDSGTLLAEEEGDTAEYQFVGTESYVRIEAVGDHTEDFDDSTDFTRRWGTSAGTWSVTGGVLNQATNTAASYVAILKRHIHGDIEAQADFRIPGSASEENVGLLINAQTNGTFWAFRILRNANTFDLYKFVGGSPSLKDTCDVTYSLNTWYTIKVLYTHATGNYKAKVWETGTTEPADWMLDHTDTTAPYDGAVGFRVKCTADMDNLYINGFKTYYQPIPVGDWG